MSKEDSSTTESETDELRKKYEELVHDLNLDKDTADKAWNSYSDLKVRFYLEVSIRYLVISNFPVALFGKYNY